MRFLSVCSGIEAASAAWHPLGWKPAAFSEIEAFPRAVLAHHYPEVPLHGDFTTIRGDEYGPIDLLVGGTPCQSFSIAGLRGGLADDRGNLALEFLRLAQRTRAKWLVWENVPGVLSSNGGRDFGSILGGMVELGYGIAYRVLDAQYFGVAQRRRRVFVVGYLGDWRRAAAVLFERESLRGDPAPRREAGKGATPSVAGSLGSRGNKSHTELDGHGAHVVHSLRADGFDASEDGTGRGTPLVPEIAGTLKQNGSKSGAENGAEVCDRLIPEVCGTLSDGAHMGGGLTARTPIADELSRCLNAGGMGRQDWETETLVAERTGGVFDGAVAYDERNVTSPGNRSNPQPGDPCMTLHDPGRSLIAFHPTQEPIHCAEVCHALNANANATAAVAIRGRDGGSTAELSDVPSALRASQGGGDKAHVLSAMRVRRLTPVECERLQGFSDNYTLIPHRGKPAADGPRYKALGNSMAVPVMRWIAERIEAVEKIGAADELAA